MSASGTINPYFYPVGLNLCGKHILIIGAGKVATRKLERLLKTGCRITCISTSVSPEFMALLANQPPVTIEKHAFDVSELASLNADYVFACTNDAQLNRHIADEAQRLGIDVNSATHGVQDSSFIVPGLIEYDDLKIALFTGGASPMFIRHLRESIASLLGPWVSPYMEILRTARRQIQAEIGTEDNRKRCYQAVLNDETLIQLVQSQGLAHSALLEQAHQMVQNHIRNHSVEPQS